MHNKALSLEVLFIQCQILIYNYLFHVGKCPGIMFHKLLICESIQWSNNDDKARRCHTGLFILSTLILIPPSDFFHEYTCITCSLSTLLTVVRFQKHSFMRSAHTHKNSYPPRSMQYWVAIDCAGKVILYISGQDTYNNIGCHFLSTYLSVFQMLLHFSELITSTCTPILLLKAEHQQCFNSHVC